MIDLKGWQLSDRQTFQLLHFRAASSQLKIQKYLNLPSLPKPELNFWLKESLCPSVCPAQSAIKVFQSSSLSQVFLRSLRSGSCLWQVSLGSLSLSASLAFFIGQMVPKILCLVNPSTELAQEDIAIGMVQFSFKYNINCHTNQRNIFLFELWKWISSHLRISFATDIPRYVCRCASIYNFWPSSIFFLICVRDKILINQ